MSTDAIPVVDAAPEAPPPPPTMALVRPEPPSQDSYTGASLLRLEQDEADSLAAPFPDDALDIKPTGEVFVSQVHYRRRLNRVFGPGQWALVPRGKWTQDGPTMMREYVLFVRGHFVAEAVGECEYQESNDRMSWADAAEGCKSNALTRACKDLGIASECWDRHFANGWRERHCVQVWVEGKRDGKNKPQWRRLDAPPFYGEGRPVQAPARPAPVRTDHPASEQSVEGHTSAADLGDWPNDTKAHERHNVEPARPAQHTSAPKVGCPQCGKPAGSSKFPKPGKTHYCYSCRHSFDPGASK